METKTVWERSEWSSVVKCFLTCIIAPGLFPATHTKTQNAMQPTVHVACACDLNMWEAKERGPPIQD